jgi:hypothetical protein
MPKKFPTGGLLFGVIDLCYRTKGILSEQQIAHAKSLPRDRWTMEGMREAKARLKRWQQSTHGPFQIAYSPCQPLMRKP